MPDVTSWHDTPREVRIGQKSARIEIIEHGDPTVPRMSTGSVSIVFGYDGVVEDLVFLNRLRWAVDEMIKRAYR